MMCMDGLLVIDKPVDMTSHDVVSSVRRILKERRIGHTGTLDPFATGVLLVLVGRATRLAQFLSGADKEYEAIIRLGYATDTGDRTGTPLPGPNTSDVRKTSRASKMERRRDRTSARKLARLYRSGPADVFSEKSRWQKLYEMARRGEVIEREPVRVCIHELEAIKPDGQLVKDNLDGTFDFHVRVVCSAGTYVRALAEDFGKRLSVGAHLAELRRTRVGDFSVTNAVSLEQLKTSFGEEA